MADYLITFIAALLLPAYMMICMVWTAAVLLAVPMLAWYFIAPRIVSQPSL